LPIASFGETRFSVERPVMASALKRLIVGKPIPSADADHQRLPNWIALPVFSSDAVSSTAYAVGEILAVTAVGGSSLALGTAKLVPIAVVVAILLVIVLISYRQTIFAYPSGGGSYIVSRENLGEYPSILAAASLLIDYVLTVAVSISAGVEAIISIKPSLASERVPICLVLILIMTLANLRGLKESGGLFAPPVYLYCGMVVLLLAYATYKGIHGTLGFVDIEKARAQGLVSEDMKNLVKGSLPVFILLKGFSSGAVALTGVEAISNGVPAFKKPEAKNAGKTMIYMGVLLGSLFFGTAVLGSKVHPYVSEKKTAIAQMGEVVFGPSTFGHILFLILQVATAAILTLAANTAYADFPRLAQMIARDGYLPRQFANVGDRLVFSNGVIFLAIAASALIIGFGGVTTALIPLYAVGVFTAFTLSQTGMVVHHFRLKEKGWRSGSIINAIGAVATLVVTLIVATTKFTAGAWIPIVIVPPMMALFIGIKKHYLRVSNATYVTPKMVNHAEPVHTVVVLVGRVHRGVVRALLYAQSLRPQHLVAITVSSDDATTAKMQKQWKEFGFDMDLEIVHSPYRQLVEPVREYIDRLDERWDNDTITVVIPEFVVTKWYQQILHNQTALRLKGALLFREGIVVTSVPYLMDGSEADFHIQGLKETGVDVKKFPGQEEEKHGH
jgi:amino acid transporter